MGHRRHNRLTSRLSRDREVPDPGGRTGWWGTSRCRGPELLGFSGMVTNAGRAPGPVAVLDGGPMDGREHPIEGDTDELCVIMADGQQHRYVRTEGLQALPGGRSAAVFAWSGRYYGPK